MHYMTFVESKEEDDKTERIQLSFWVNDKSKIFFEMQPHGNEDYYNYQCMALGREDVERMISELQTLLKDYDLQS